ncbi:hypothetical protein SAMN06264855_10246 [Halorubrum vacuolatum]|uniref:Uncharacterized protein n=1 Tax=Halorubrum vacuolatum TaxID=63740 RepID=A0A238V864_HALVU|nr:hypothetical protein SAMN06264855_10246 [Halorubrum vacuolatum]
MFYILIGASLPPTDLVSWSLRWIDACLYTVTGSRVDPVVFRLILAARRPIGRLKRDLIDYY